MAFLVSPGARWMTGSTLRMDGGEVKSIQCASWVGNPPFFVKHEIELARHSSTRAEAPLSISSKRTTAIARISLSSERKPKGCGPQQERSFVGMLARKSKIYFPREAVVAEPGKERTKSSCLRRQKLPTAVGSYGKPRLEASARFSFVIYGNPVAGGRAPSAESDMIPSERSSAAAFCRSSSSSSHGGCVCRGRRRHWKGRASWASSV